MNLSCLHCLFNEMLFDCILRARYQEVHVCILGTSYQEAHVPSQLTLNV